VGDDGTRILKTLERVISKAGLGSRSQARSWVHAGRATVNGDPTQNPDQWVDPAVDDVRFDGKPLPTLDKRYVLLHKPTGYLTTRRDPDGRPTVYALLDDVGQFLPYVGRLDLDTSGLLILTNDNAFAEQVTNPAFHVPKTYLVETSARLSDEKLQRLRDGLVLEDGPTRPAIVERLGGDGGAAFEITITEGRNRQVRRMVEALGARALSLVRTRIGPLAIEDLPTGRWRDLSALEVETVRRSGASQAAGA
jgi:23S rRNA pseudouridine2605 synthase